MPETPSEKTRVMIVDDIAETRENIRKLLQFEPDFEVVATARTGREAVQFAREQGPHVVLMDINMPDMDGITATEAISRDVPFTQIVILSVQSDSDYMRRAMLAGARDFLAKPPAGDELINTIRKLGQRSREEQQKLARPAQPAGGRPGGPAAGLLPEGRIISVFSPKGGVGCTMVATNLAIAMHTDDTRVVLVDGSVQFGDVEVFLNLQSRTNIIDLAERADELDSEIV
ncbi:MAG: response regulator [Chloroflexi bacterium]|nr:response regulator [Chloroflexota bacterium]